MFNFVYLSDIEKSRVDEQCLRCGLTCPSSNFHQYHRRYIKFSLSEHQYSLSVAKIVEGGNWLRTSLMMPRRKLHCPTKIQKKITHLKRNMHISTDFLVRTQR